MKPHDMLLDMIKKHFLEDGNYVLTREQFQDILQKIVKKYKNEK